ncbi:hypothetical protein ACVI8K_004579 [Bradyrhizobium barranii subsp. barranii]
MMTSGEVIEVDGLALDLGGVRNQAVGGTAIQPEVTFDQAVQLALLGRRRLTVQRDHVNQQRGGRKPVIAIAECAIPGMRGHNVGDELAQAVEHRILPKTMKPRGAAATSII